MSRTTGEAAEPRHREHTLHNHHNNKDMEIITLYYLLHMTLKVSQE